MELARWKRPLAAVAALALALGLVTGCAGANEEYSADEVGRSSGSVTQVAPDAPVTGEYASEPGIATDGTAAADTANTDRLVIRSKTLRLEVQDTSDAVDAVRQLAKTHSAVITDLQVATDTDEWVYRYDEYGYSVGDGAALRGWVTVRVPAESLDAFVEAAIGLGTVKYQSEATDDVTEEHVDLTARLDNLKAEEVRLRSFFDQAKTVQDMLLVEAELNRVRAEIESMTAQVTYLERQAAMATVTIEVTEEQDIVRPEGDDWGFSDAVTAGFRGAAGVLTFGLAALIASAPLWITGLLAFFVVRAILRRRKAARAGDDSGDSARVDSTGPTDGIGA